MLSVNFPGGEKMLGSMPEGATGGGSLDFEVGGNLQAGRGVKPVVNGLGDSHPGLFDGNGQVRNGLPSLEKRGLRPKWPGGVL